MVQGRLSELATELAAERFSKLYRDQYDAVLAFALRRAASPEDAADVVAEAFLTAWRHLTAVPTGTDCRLWLYTVARNALANQRRGELRRGRLADRLRHELRSRPDALPAAEPESGLVLRSLARLDEGDRELLLLVGWEELRPKEAAHVLGISAIAVRTRLHRARRRLAAILSESEASAAGEVGFEIECEES